MKTTKTTKTTKSDSKKTAPKKGASKSAPAKVESKPKKTSKKSTAKDLPKTEVITEAKPVVAEAPAKVEAAPPKPAPRITEVPIDVLVPGAAIKGNSGRMYISIEERDALHAIIGPITVTLHDEEFDVEHAVRIIDGVAS